MELYNAKYGISVNDEAEHREYDADGTPWTKTVGHVVPTQEKLEVMLGEVKDMYKLKYGADVDDKDVEHDTDGTPWVTIVGQQAATQDRLEEMLDEVNELYTAKYG